MECYSPISEDQNSAMSSNMDGLRGHYALRNKLEKDNLKKDRKTV